MEPFNPDSFEKVFSSELEEIAKRQGKQSAKEVDRTALAGIALSGGGIRSATSSLGALQALRKLGILHAFDYLSTVSGGGFTGSWWSAWTSRPFEASASKDEKFFPPIERTQPERDELQKNSAKTDPTRLRSLIDPVHHLRLFSNYLTPMKGPMSSDTWRANAVISRNLALTWLVLIPMIFAAVLVAQSYFTVQPNSETEFLYPYSHFADDDVRVENIAFEIKVANRLDSIVHGSPQTTSLVPVGELRKWREKEKIVAAIGTSQGAFPQIAHQIDSLQTIDSLSAADIKDSKSFSILSVELDRVEKGILDWRRDDSLLDANRAVAASPVAASVVAASVVAASATHRSILPEAAPHSDTPHTNTSEIAHAASISAKAPSVKSLSAQTLTISHLPKASSVLHRGLAKQPRGMSSTKIPQPSGMRAGLPSTKPDNILPSAGNSPPSAMMPAMALAPLKTFFYQKAKDSIDQSYEKSLDPTVDSLKMHLALFQQEVLLDRMEHRNSLLFNRTHLGYLANRAEWASFLPVMMLGWIVTLICLWMINSGHRMFGGNVLQGTYAFLGGLVAYIIFSWLVSGLLGTHKVNGWALKDSGTLLLLWSAGALVLINLLVWDDAHRFWKKFRKSWSGNLDSAERHQMLKLLEIRRSRIVTYHQRLLLGAFLISILLAFGAYGHEVINYLFFYHSGESKDLWQWLARSGGVAAIFGALMGTGFAARNATSRNDRGEVKKSGKLRSLLIALAPPLILMLLLCGVSWTSHWILQDLVFQGGSRVDSDYLSLVFTMWLLGFLSLYYAVFDLHFRTRQSKGRRARQFSRLLLAAVVLIQILLMSTVILYPSSKFAFANAGWLALPTMLWLVVAWKYRWEQNHPQLAETGTVLSPAFEQETDSTAKSSLLARLGSFASMTGVSILILAISLVGIVLSSLIMGAAELPIDHLFVVELGASILILILDLLWGIRAPEEGRRSNHEARILLGINVTLITLFLTIPPLAENPHWGVTHVLEVLISLAIGAVIFIGWRIDPNTLSIHEYYRNRIVRAYLGASNWLRSRHAATLDHPEDDIALTDLSNCDHGAPYHLINTTLNLLGTKSLETAQRHASNFIFSKRYCGSVTTGYRPTGEYMSSTMTLGTAVAISGAAASPNMGSNQVSGATTMLMSLLNVRLGYWAANPGRSRWREAQPKLWPYYLLKESLSQTSGFGAFCYLTDGGHFDNTGLYPLIERACRYIVLCDNGADPNAHFKDLGNALRRCRIDFGVEFQLDGLKEMTSMAGSGTTGSHWLRGTVRYCEEHVARLWGTAWADGLSPREKAKRLTGTILILKPSLIGDEPADVLQYGLEYADFPQQSTANQWFSEDQFESYRRLGFWSAQQAFDNQDYTGADREGLLLAIERYPQQPTVASASGTIPDLAYGPKLEKA